MVARPVGTTPSLYPFNGQIIAQRSSDASGLISLHAAHLGGGSVSRQEFDPWGAIRSGGISQTSLNYTGQRRDGTGLLYYHARYYDPALSRFLSADTIVPGVAEGKGGDAATLGVNEQTRSVLTVDFHEPQFVKRLREEHQFTLEHGFWFQLNESDRKEAKEHWGPQNPQALNRYSYVQNNPLRYTDPTGHMPQALAGAGVGFFVCGPACAIAGAVIMVGAGVAAMYVGAKAGDYIANHVLQAKKSESVESKTDRSAYPPAARKRYNTKKEAYEAAKRAGKGNEPVHDPHGKHGPHYHPGDGKGGRLNHDHYYYPKNRW